MPTRSFGAYLDTLRVRICMVPPMEESILRETELATEFSMSRTPVRQILQALEREHLIEIRAGYGSTVVAYRPEDRIRSYQLVRDLSWAAARYCEGQTLSHSDVLEYASIRTLVDSSQPLNVETYIRLASRLSQAHVSRIPDPILADALMSTFWRVLRWRTEDMRNAPDETGRQFVETVAKIAKAAEGATLSGVLHAVAGVGEHYASVMPEQLDAEVAPVI